MNLSFPPRQIYYGQPVNWRHPLNVGLVSWWKALPKYAGGARLIDLCNRNPGTLTNGPLWVGGRHFSALKFDATDDLVNCGANASLKMANNLTFAGWVFPLSYGEGSKGRMYDNQSAGGSTLQINNIDTTAGYVWSGGGDHKFPNSAVLSAWSYLVLTADSSNVILYLNGVQNTSVATIGPLIASTGSFYIGNRGAADRTWDGILDDLRIYNRTLTASEALRLYVESSVPYSKLYNYVGHEYLLGQAAATGPFPPYPSIFTRTAVDRAATY